METLSGKEETVVQVFQIIGATQRLRIQAYIKSEDDVRTFTGLVMNAVTGLTDIGALAQILYEDFGNPDIFATGPAERREVGKSVMSNFTKMMVAYMCGPNAEESLQGAIAGPTALLYSQSQAVLAACFNDKKTSQRIMHEFKAFAEWISR